MTENTTPETDETTEASLAEYAADAEPQVTVRTDWASPERMEGIESFDEDQADVNAWVNALPETRTEALERTMTLADAEELIATCATVALQHERRADEARALAATVAQRLGREAGKVGVNATTKPTAGIATQHPVGARAVEQTHTAVMPTAGAAK